MQDTTAPRIVWPDRIVRGEPPTLAVWKFASCDGCQLSILDCEDELMAVAERVAISYFPEATSGMVDGPYDVSLVEGSISTDHDAERIVEIRRQSSLLVTIGACATAGGIQALRNGRDVDGFRSIVYAHPEFVDTLATSTPIVDHVSVDLELRGCPIDRTQLLQTLAAVLDRHAAAAAHHERVHGVQGAGPGLRDGRARRAVHRSRDPGRLRCTLPGVPSRVLRMLRSDGESERAGAPSSVGTARSRRRGGRSPAPHVQHGGVRPGRRWCRRPR